MWFSDPFPQLTHAVTCWKVLSMCVRLDWDQLNDGADTPVLSEEKDSVAVSGAALRFM